MNSLDLDVLRTALTWMNEAHRVTLGTVVKTWGSSPRPPGSVMALRDDGQVAGSVSGGCIEDDLIYRLRKGDPAFARVLAEELLLMSTPYDTGWNWSISAFYSDEDTDNTGTTPSPPPLDFLGELFGSLSNFRNKQTAIFGELGYKWDSGLAATAGVRYTRYNSDAKINLLGLFALPIPVDVSFDERPVTPHFALSYSTGGQLYYVQASKGFRLGKGNFPVIPVEGITVPPYAASDSLWTYDLGAKTEWLDRRMSLNAAVYYTDWKNVMAILYPSPSSPRRFATGIR